MINSEKVKGDGSTVTFWNLIRSYILLHHKDEDVIFYAHGMNDNLDFLHYSYIKVISEDSNWDDEVKKIKYNVEDLSEIEEDDEEYDTMMVEYKNGKFLNNK